jgi:hypothetical protein
MYGVLHALLNRNILLILFYILFINLDLFAQRAFNDDFMVTIDLSNFGPGIYMVRIWNEPNNQLLNIIMK